MSQDIAATLAGRLFAGRTLHEKQVEEISAALAPLLAAAKAEALRESAKDAEYELDIVGEDMKNAPSTWLRLRATNLEGRALVKATHDRKAHA